MAGAERAGPAQAASGGFALFTMLRRIITVQNIGAAVGVVTLAGVALSVATSWATRNADTAAAGRHAAEFEQSVAQQLKDQRDWQAQTERDREAVRNALYAKIEELTARFNQRSDARNEQFAGVYLRLSALELKWCIYAKRGIAECK